MKPLDPRLLRHARRARPALAAVVAIGVAQAGLLIAQLLALAEIIVAPIERGLSVAALTGPITALAATVLVRGALSWLSEVMAQRAALTVTSELRSTTLRHCLALGPGWLSGARRGELTALLTRGVSALDPYVGRYLPTLVLAGVTPPLAIGVIALADPWSAGIIVLTLPLVPVFGALVGWATERRSQRQWRSMAALAGHFADATAGLPTLLAYRRAHAQSRQIADVTRRHAKASMSTLRLAFASSAVLEFVATISVALVAVSVGLRLIDAEIGFHAALIVLLLAPEAYWPLRRVGAEFHAAAEGLAAVSQLMAVLDTPLPARGTRTDVPDLRRAVIEVRDLVVSYPGRSQPAVGPANLTLTPGKVHALTGPSGCGKSTIIAALLGFAPITSGEILLDGRPLAEFDPDAVRAQIGWLPQSPALLSGTLADSVRLLRPDATEPELRAALAEVGLAEVVAGLPHGLDTMLDGSMTPLSAGERSRLALARILVADRPLVLLDEPSARLDQASEDVILATVRRLARRSTVLMVSHRARSVAAADRRIELRRPDPAIPDHPAAQAELAQV